MRPTFHDLRLRFLWHTLLQTNMTLTLLGDGRDEKFLQYLDSKGSLFYSKVSIRELTCTRIFVFRWINRWHMINVQARPCHMFFFSPGICPWAIFSVWDLAVNVRKCFCSRFVLDICQLSAPVHWYNKCRRVACRRSQVQVRSMALLIKWKLCRPNTLDRCNEQEEN